MPLSAARSSSYYVGLHYLTLTSCSNTLTAPQVFSVYIGQRIYYYTIVYYGLLEMPSRDGLRGCKKNGKVIGEIGFAKQKLMQI